MNLCASQDDARPERGPRESKAAVGLRIIRLPNFRDSRSSVSSSKSVSSLDGIVQFKQIAAREINAGEEPQRQVIEKLSDKAAPKKRN